MMLRVHRMGKTILNVSVARWERGLQGFDDDPNWWIHPLLPNAHRPQCRQVHQHHHLEYHILIPAVTFRHASVSSTYPCQMSVGP